MHGLALINAFERRIEHDYLPHRSQLLWYKLFALCNRVGWPEWVTVDNRRMMGMTDIGREETLVNARDKLIAGGYIEYQRGRKGAPGKYKLTDLTFTSGVQSGVNTGVQSGVNTGVQSGVQSGDITTYLSYPSDTPDTTYTNTNTTNTDTPRSRAAPRRSQASDPPIATQISEFTESAELRDSLTAWTQMRTKIRKPLTERAMKLALKELRRISATDDDGITIVNQAIMRNWQSFYPIDNGGGRLATDSRPTPGGSRLKPSKFTPEQCGDVF